MYDKWSRHENYVRDGEILKNKVIKIFKWKSRMYDSKGEREEETKEGWERVFVFVFGGYLYKL